MDHWNWCFEKKLFSLQKRDAIPIDPLKVAVPKNNSTPKEL